MRTAILFTGQLRTFPQTHPNLYTNLIVPNNADLFFYLFPDSMIDANILLTYGDRIKQIVYMTDSELKDYNEELSRLLDTKPAYRPEILGRAGVHPNYLRASGSILEYYQFYKCYALMTAFEKSHEVQYDLVIRCRPDVAFASPINLVRFFTLLPTIRVLEPQPDHPKDFGCAIGHCQDYYANRIDDPSQLVQCGRIPMYLVDHHKIPATQHVILSIRKNNFWCGLRADMDLLHDMFFTMGDVVDDYPWVWDSETQFHHNLSARGLVHVDYFTHAMHESSVSRHRNLTFLKDPGDAEYTMIRDERHVFERL